MITTEVADRSSIHAPGFVYDHTRPFVLWVAEDAGGDGRQGNRCRADFCGAKQTVLDGGAEKPLLAPGSPDRPDGVDDPLRG